MVSESRRARETERRLNGGYCVNVHVLCYLCDINFLFTTLVVRYLSQLLRA